MNTFKIGDLVLLKNNPNPIVIYKITEIEVTTYAAFDETRVKVCATLTPNKDANKQFRQEDIRDLNKFE
jgi:hypothetical protein